MVPRHVRYVRRRRGVEPDHDVRRAVRDRRRHRRADRCARRGRGRRCAHRRRPRRLICYRRRGMKRLPRLWTVVCLIALAGCPPGKPSRSGTTVTASGEVPYPTDFTPPPPLPAPPPADGKAFGAKYLDQAYARIGDDWTAFLEDCRLRLPPQHPLNDRSLAATASITLDAQGHVVEVTLLDKSGNDDFDEVARAVATDAGPFPAPDR
ncbi:MAG: TonB C-terminal domain-containing protein, partial [Kofleriaceae bacterium]